MGALGRLVLNWPLFWANRLFNISNPLPINYTFSLTNRCNSKCRTCRIWDNPLENELSCNEWVKVISSLGGAPIWVTISGGEPFLFSEIDIVADAIFAHCNPMLVVIPTNGLLPDIIEGKLKSILSKKTKQGKLTVNVSLDGIGDMHDEIRGVPGNFRKVMETLSMLNAMKRQGYDFVIGIHSVLSKWNIDNVKEISDFVWDEINPGHHIFEIAEVRQEMFNSENMPTPSVEQYKRFLEFWFTDRKVISARKKLKGISKITDMFRRKYYHYLLDAVYNADGRELPSFAGYANVHIAPNGEVWDCAVYADVLGNLRDYDLDFRKFWKACPGVNDVQERVKKSHKCPLANENYVNMLLSPWRLIFG